MSDPVFSSEYPSSESPIIPPYFIRQIVGHLLPGQVVYPYPSLFKYERFTGLVLVETTTDLEDNELEPDDMDNRAGLVKVLGDYGGCAIDGFVADLRNLQPGSIEPFSDRRETEEGRELIGASTAGEELTTQEQAARVKEWIKDSGFEALLAVVFRDPNEQNHFMGNPSLRPVISSLMRDVDLRVSNTISSQTPTPPLSREEAALKELKASPKSKQATRRRS